MDPKSAACVAALGLFALWASGRPWDKKSDEPSDHRIAKSVRKSMDDIHLDVMSGKRSLRESAQLLTIVSLRDDTVRIAYETTGKAFDLRSADFLLQWTEDMTRRLNEPLKQLAAESLVRLREEHAAMHESYEE